MNSPVLQPVARRRFMQYLGGGAPQGYRMWVQEQLLTPVQTALEGIIPESLRSHYQEVRELEERVGQSPDTPLQLRPADAPLLRRAAIHYRYQVALQQERLHAVNVDPDHAATIDKRSDEVDSDLAEPWLSVAQPHPRPTLTEYVNLKTARAIVETLGHGVFPPRRYDDKFGILWPPSAVQDLLEACRVESWLLRTGTCVAFIDIDDFKKVNTSLTETVVDRSVLPKLMLLLEAHTSQRGYAVRQGGDEYLLILPNSECDEARAILESIRKAVSAVFPSNPRITLSIGYVRFASDSPHTNHQILHQANCAKDEAKKQGKDRVVYRDTAA